MAVALELIITEFVFLAIICGVLIRHYQSSLVTWDVTCTVYMSWVLGFAAVLLLPYDLSLAIVYDLQSTILSTIWSFVYWSTFLLAWMILPIQMEYHSSGHFNVKDKLLDALKRLFLAGLIAFVLGIAYIIFMVASKGLTFTEVISFSMAMSNTYGVLLITVLMGSGLVSLPKRLWNMADSDNELKRLYISALTVEEAYQESRYELEDCEVEVKKAVELLERSGPGSQVAHSVGPYILQLKEKAANFNFAGRATTSNYLKSQTEGRTPVDYSEKKALVTLHARLIKCQIKARASERRWRVLIEHCKRHQDVQKADLSDEDIELGWCLMPVGSSNSDNATMSGFQKYLARCYLNLYKFWVHYCYRGMCKVSAVVLGICSCLILWSEMLMATTLHSPIGFLMGAYELNNAHPVIVQAVAFLALAYMSICTYWTLFRLNIGWSYRLQGPQLSPPSSLIFNAEYLSRLQFALGYNFLLCINVSRTEKTAFRNLMQNIEVIPVFGTSFTVYMPILMIIIALITFLDGLPRVLSFLGVDSEESVYASGNCLSCWPHKGSGEDMDAGLLEKCNNGKQVIQNELKQAAQRQEQFNRSRATLNGTSSHENVGSKVGSAPIALKESIVRSPFLSSFTDKMSGPRYGNLEMTSPGGALEDDEDDDLSSSIFNTSAWKDKKTAPLSELRKPVHLPSSSITGTKAGNINSRTQSKPNPSRDFSFLVDEDEEESGYGGRYSHL